VRDSGRVRPVRAVLRGAGGSPPGRGRLERDHRTYKVPVRGAGARGGGASSQRGFSTRRDTTRTPEAILHGLVRGAAGGASSSVEPEARTSGRRVSSTRPDLRANTHAHTANASARMGTPSTVACHRQRPL